MLTRISMNKLQHGIYERLVREDENDDLRTLEIEGRAWLETPSENQRHRLLIDEFTAHIPELLDAVASGSQQDSEAARLELKLIAELLRAARSCVPETKLPSPPSTDVRVLHAVHEPNLRPVIPRTGLRQPWLFTSAKGEPSLYSELRAELETAEQLDLIISFITWGGVRKLEDVFARATATDAEGRFRLKMRIITTTYMGATDRNAVDALAKLPGVEVRVSLDGRRERLHAKAWLFGRGNGFGTAFVGSANLSKSALIDGIEWTLKISQTREPALFEAAKANFESHWNDPEFQHYDPRNSEHAAALDRALLEQRGGHGSAVPLLRTWFDLQPKQFQQAILDRLDHERAHGRTRNLLVAATGTGKTIVSAFDYKRLCDRQGGQPRLIFVAHQRQILQQAMDTFRQVLRDPNFGELLDGQTQAKNHDHLFATIQTLTTRKLVTRLGAGYWQMAVVDEAHHLPATTFDTFVREIRPKFLLGLTATPERADGKSLNLYFDSRPDGSPAYSLRVWDALDQQLLSPFEYYATSDGVDLREVEWGKASELQQLGKIIGANEMRAMAVLHSLKKYLQEDGLCEMKAIAFCVTIEHAQFMAAFFNGKGLTAESLTGNDNQTTRDDAIRRLDSGQLKILCTVNLFNEGVDIPSVNTLILLRPTQSPVVFQQQIGRGLRLHPGKSCCVVLDFIGQYGTSYRFDILYRGLTGMNRRQLQQSVEAGFGYLPAGCHIQLDKVSRERVLQNLRQSLLLNRSRLQRELASWASGQTGPIRLRDFLQGQMVELVELYENKRSWNALKREVGLPVPEFGDRDAGLLERAESLIHMNSPRLLSGWQAWLDGGNIGTRQILMLAHQLLHERMPIQICDFRNLLEANQAMKAEMRELLEYLEESSDLAETVVSGAPEEWPISLHGRYSRRQLQAATGNATEFVRPTHREGVLPIAQQLCELLFVTLDKSIGFSEAVQYADYAVSPSLFHWKTQNRAKPTNASGRRYIESPANGWKFFLFVREDRDAAFSCAGQVVLDQYEFNGKGPIGITWRLIQPLNADLFRRFSMLRDA